MNRSLKFSKESVAKITAASLSPSHSSDSSEFNAPTNDPNQRGDTRGKKARGKRGGNPQANNPQGEHEDSEVLKELLARPKKIRQGGMNKTETEFSHILEQAKRSGQILKWHFEEITLKIAPNTRYIPDFIAVLPDGHWQVFEIKGHLEDDAAVKFKAAAEKFPEVNFHMIRKRKKQWETIYNIPSPPPYKNNSLNNSPDNPPEVTPKKGSKNKKVNGGEPKWTLKLLAE